MKIEAWRQLGVEEVTQLRTVAVTGATGLIGRRLVPTLLREGLSLRALVRTPLTVAGSDEVPGDLRSEAALPELVRGSDAVVHLAGVAHTRLRSATEEAEAREINVEGTRRLARAAAEHGVQHFLFISSAHVFRGQAGIDLAEDSPTAADTAYGRMKLESEAIALEAATPRMRVTILRPCLIYGPGVRFNLQSLMHAVRGRYYVHVRGMDAVRSVASVDTVVAAIAHLMRGRWDSSIFNVADKAPVNLRTWVNHLADLLHVRHPYSLPESGMSFAAALGSALQRAHLPASFTRDSLRKLTSSFSLNTDRLASTGFIWPGNEDEVLEQMIAAEFKRS